MFDGRLCCLDYIKSMSCGLAATNFDPRISWLDDLRRLESYTYLTIISGISLHFSSSIPKSLYAESSLSAIFLF